MTDQDIRVIKKLMQKLVTHSDCLADFWTEDGKVHREVRLGSLGVGPSGKRILKAKWRCKTCSMPISRCGRNRKRDHFATFK